MWKELTESQKEYIAKMYKLYEVHETYNKHDKNKVICNCGKIIAPLRVDKNEAKKISIENYNLILVVNSYKDTLYIEDDFEKLSIPLLKDYKKYDILCGILYEIKNKNEIEALLNYDPKISEYMAENLAYISTSIPNDIKNKIVKMAIKNPKVKLNIWVINEIVNDTDIDIDKIKNKINFKKIKLIDLYIDKQNIQEKINRTTKLIIKYNIKNIRIKIV